MKTKQAMIDAINDADSWDKIRAMGFTPIASDSYGNYYCVKQQGPVTIRINVMDMAENAYAHDVEWDGEQNFTADDDVSGWENE